MKRIIDIIDFITGNEKSIPIIALIIIVVSWHQGVQGYLKSHLYNHKEDHEEEHK